MTKKLFSLPLYPDLTPEYINENLIPFLIENRESIFDIYFTSRIAPFDQDAMGTIFDEKDLNGLMANAIIIQNKTGIPVSATFNNKFISPSYDNMVLWINNFKELYKYGVKSATIPFTSWLMFGEIQKEFPELYIKNTVLWALDKPREIYDAYISGFDYINLDRNLIRSQDDIINIDKARRKAEEKLGKKLKLSILYNESCIGNCPIQEEHYLYNTHNNNQTQKKVFFKSKMNEISCTKWEKNDKSYGFKRANVIYDSEFLKGLELVDVFKLHGRENRLVFENSLSIISHFDTNTELKDEFKILKEKYGMTDTEWTEWIKIVKNCNFDCWNCSKCDDIVNK